MAKKSERVTGKNKRKSAKCSRKRRKCFGAWGEVKVWMEWEIVASRDVMRWRKGGGVVVGLGGGLSTPIVDVEKEVAVTDWVRKKWNVLTG